MKKIKKKKIVWLQKIDLCTGIFITIWQWLKIGDNPIDHQWNGIELNTLKQSKNDYHNNHYKEASQCNIQQNKTYIQKLHIIW